MPRSPGPPRSVSVVVNTYNRAASLRLTLAGLRQVDFPDFEVVVVNGPSTDDTEAVLAGYAGQIKVGTCPERNLSMSRNIGIALAAGDIVAFIDDDAYPDPAWLDRIVEGYADDEKDEVAGVGGPVYNHTGAVWQTRFLISDRIGRSVLEFDNDLWKWMCVPGAGRFPSLLGTNSSFRRDRLVEIGGFDEEFEYFLDETDVCARLVDAGYVIRQLWHGIVYHKFLPSDIRGESRAARDRYLVTKNTCYFALKNADQGSSFYDTCAGLAEFVQTQRYDYAWNIEHGLLDSDDLAKFEAELGLAFDTGLARYQSGVDKTKNLQFFADGQQPYSPFPILRPGSEKLHICLVSQDYPPRPLGGIGRYVDTIAQGLAAEGHVVRVITKGESHTRVDLEDGVWVHRIVAVPHLQPPGVDAPAHIWDHSAQVLDELRRIDLDRPVDVVQVPNWDAEGLATLLDGKFRCVLGLYTPMRTLQRIDPRLAGDPVADRIAECERLCYQRAESLLADSAAVIDEIETQYGLRLPGQRLEVIHLGLPDRTGDIGRPGRTGDIGRPGRTGDIGPGDGAAGGLGLSEGLEAASQADPITILFVGRLEKRKGIDTLLACLPGVLDQVPHARVVLAGRDDLLDDSGHTFRAAFEASGEGRRLADRVRFLGRVSDEELVRLYAGCDVFVAPSRYESFGLILLEAMMFAKAVVGGDVGGVREIVTDGDSGLLVAPGDADALGKALVTLCHSADLRGRLGRRAREVYEQRFTIAHMVQRTNAYYDRLTGRQTTRA